MHSTALRMERRSALIDPTNIREQLMDNTRWSARLRGRRGSLSPWWPGGTLTRLDRRNLHAEKEFKPRSDRATEGKRWPGPSAPRHASAVHGHSGPGVVSASSKVPFLDMIGRG
jgi:hypothetical protein